MTNENSKQSYADSSGCAAEEIARLKQNLEFQCRYNIDIVGDYANHYSLLCSLVNFVSLAMSLSVVYSVFQDEWESFTIASGLIVGVVNAAATAFKINDKSVEEFCRKSSYSEILTRLHSASSLAELNQIDSDMEKIQDPKRNEVSRALSYNEVRRQMGRDEVYEVGWFKRLTRFWFPWRLPSKS